ncbi:MAG TPA: phosphatase PAP2 family protein [Paraburkholderia sp.]|nr:phosphatase PAP2 family protein [Paraburkholderia sp.]
MWRMFTNLGDAAVTLPVALTCSIWIALFDVRLACRWLVALAAGMCIVGATKILHAGWGLSFPASHFRVISGHAMLSTSVWIVAFALQFKWWRLPPEAGIAIGLIVGLLTGMSRVLNQSHSLSEAFAGWVVGAVVALIFLRNARHVEFERFRPVWPTLSILLISALAYGHTAPLQRLIETHSPAIHRHTVSFTTFFHHLRHPFHSQETTVEN